MPATCNAVDSSVARTASAPPTQRPRFTLDGSDYPSHAAQETAIAGYLRWRNRHCHPKRHFAVNSKIRRPDYLPNVA